MPSRTLPFPLNLPRSFQASAILETQTAEHKGCKTAVRSHIANSAQVKKTRGQLTTVEPVCSRSRHLQAVTAVDAVPSLRIHGDWAKGSLGDFDLYPEDKHTQDDLRSKDPGTLAQGRC